MFTISKQLGNMDLEKHIQSIEYARQFLPVLHGENYEMMQHYPDTTDNSVLQFIFDTIDPVQLDNQWFYEDLQSVLDQWLIEELTPAQARAGVIAVFDDYVDFGC
jgi:UDP-2,3-diacylglucosamine pyrophosphatase LpxH